MPTEREDRIQKLAIFSHPYPSKSKRTHLINNVLEGFDNLKDKNIYLAGRLISKREHGKLIFADLLDESGKIQLVFNQDDLGKEKYKLFKNIDVADIIQVNGFCYLTQKGEKSLLIKNFVLLAKAIEPLPEKWHGIQDEETRYRKRYLDLLLNPGLVEIFRKKAVFWQSMRDFLISKGFLEVETPVLETTPGGADAKPFITHHNALDLDLYLRISMGELWQKRLMVAGLRKTFEIGRQFRNEGIDAEHLQDYAQMEFYLSYANYEDTMKLVEELYKYVIEKTFNTLKFKIKNFNIDFSKSWNKIDYVDTVKKELSIDILAANENELITKCKELKLEIPKGSGRGRLMDTLWKKIRKTVAGPTFLINHPVAVSPLAKRKEDNNELVERYQVIIAGSEIGNGYTELNDPMDQATRFNEQTKLREAGDEEAQMHDEDYVQALEHGMPPTSGFGVSERLFAFLVDKPVRECVLFPLLRPKKSNKIIFKNNMDIQFNIPRETSLQLLKQHIKNPANFNHALESEAVLRSLAKKLRQNVDLWGAAGLLHDLDWEETVNNTKQHGLKTAEYLIKFNYPQELISAIKSHNFEDNQDTEPKAILDFGVRCGEMITGLIYACALVRPDKKLASVEVKSVKKKMKDKAFAANVRREIIKECEKIGVNLDEFLEISLIAMKEIASEVGI